MPDVTHILSAIDAGDPQPAALLLPLVYDDRRPCEESFMMQLGRAVSW